MFVVAERMLADLWQALGGADARKAAPTAHSPGQLSVGFADKCVGGFASLSLQFAYNDLAAATCDFRQANKLGAGSAGEVYRGCLRGGTEVAVKVVCGAGLRSFAAEVEVLSRFRHPNLVILLGWGQKGPDRTKFLVYELLQCGSVSQRLYKSRLGREAFPWQHRLRVASDAACGLAYMANSKPRAFHRDIKTSNILLDASGGAKVADFGLASTPEPWQSHLSVEEPSGTPGYVCPEYVRTGEVTERSEVFSFGIVLLELLLNELPAKMGLEGGIEYPIMRAVRPGERGALRRVAGLLDAGAGWPPPLAEDVARLALQCVEDTPALRPSFAQIVMGLRALHHQALFLEQCPPPKAASDPKANAQLQKPWMQVPMQQSGDQPWLQLPMPVRSWTCCSAEVVCPGKEAPPALPLALSRHYEEAASFSSPLPVDALDFGAWTTREPPPSSPRLPPSAELQQLRTPPSALAQPLVSEPPVATPRPVPPRPTLSWTPAKSKTSAGPGRRFYALAPPSKQGDESLP